MFQRKEGHDFHFPILFPQVPRSGYNDDTAACGCSSDVRQRTLRLTNLVSGASMCEAWIEAPIAKSAEAIKAALLPASDDNCVIVARSEIEAYALAR